MQDIWEVFKLKPIRKIEDLEDKTIKKIILKVNNVIIITEDGYFLELIETIDRIGDCSSIEKVDVRQILNDIQQGNLNIKDDLFEYNVLDFDKYEEYLRTIGKDLEKLKYKKLIEENEQKISQLKKEIEQYEKHIKENN